MQTHQIIIAPVTTEKSTKENAEGKYTFNIHKNATKIDVKRATKELFGLDIESVRIISVVEKSRLVKNRNKLIKRKAHKKAVITTVGRKKIDINKFAATK